MIDLLPKPAKNGRTPLPVVLLRTPTGTAKALLDYPPTKVISQRTPAFRMIVDLPLGDEEHSDRKKTSKMKVSFVRCPGFTCYPWRGLTERGETVRSGERQRWKFP